MTQALLTNSPTPAPTTITIIETAQAAPVDLDVAFLTTRQRLKRALSTLGYVWFAALLAVTVPVLHLVLVPVFLLAGPIAAVFSFRTRVRLDPGTRVPCPKCASMFAVESEHYGWPLRLRCRRCFAALSATPREPA